MTGNLLHSYTLMRLKIKSQRVW